MDKIVTPAELRTARTALDLSREEVAGGVGVSFPTIRNLELGQVRGKPYRASPELSAKLVQFFHARGLVFLPREQGRAFGVDVAER